MSDDLLQKIADRAGELALMTMRELRLTHPDNYDGTKTGQQWIRISKSKLISDILFEEFSEVE